MATPNLPTVKFPWRMAIYGIAILYIALDMYVLHGPLSRMIDRMHGEGIEEQIAKVQTDGATEAELARAIRMSVSDQFDTLTTMRGQASDLGSNMSCLNC